MKPFYEDAAAVFNEAWRMFNRLPEHLNRGQCLDLTIPIRFRLFYSLDAMRDEWARQAIAGGWPCKDITGWCGTALQPMPPTRATWEVWTVLRHDGAGRMVTPHLVLGHEVTHVLDGMTAVMASPDDLARPRPGLE